MLVTNCQALIHNEVVMKDFRQLKVWEKAHLLALAVYPFGEISPRRNLWTHGSDSAGRLLDSLQHR